MVSTTKITEKEIVITRAQAPRTRLMVLGAVAVLFTIAPIWMVFGGSSIEKGLFVLTAVAFIGFWGFAFLFVKAFLWNFYGREIIRFAPDHIIYFADYKWFKGNRQRMATDSFSIDIVQDAEGADRRRFQLVGDGGKIGNRLWIYPIDLNHIIRKLKFEYPLGLLNAELSALAIEGGKFTFFRQRANRFGYEFYIKRKSGKELKLQFWNLVRIDFTVDGKPQEIDLAESYSDKKTPEVLKTCFDTVRQRPVSGYSLEDKSAEIKAIQERFDFRLFKLTFVMDSFSTGFIYHNLTIDEPEKK